MKKYRKIIYFKDMSYIGKEHNITYEFDDNFAKSQGLIKKEECFIYFPVDPDNIRVNFFELSQDTFNMAMELQKDFFEINQHRKFLKKICEKIVFEPIEENCKIPHTFQKNHRVSNFLYLKMKASRQMMSSWFHTMGNMLRSCIFR